MKKILSILAASLLLMSLFITTGCDPDPVDPVIKDAPLLIIGSSSDVVDGQTLEIEQSNVGTVSFTLIGSVGTDPLNTVKISGITNPSINLTSSGATEIGSNAVLITDATETGGFTWDMVYTIENNAIGDYPISFELADEGGLVDGVSFTIRVIEDVFVGTPIDMTLTGVLFNQANPMAGTGSLDLDEGKGSGVTSDGDVPKEDAEIRDMGLDCTVAPADFNWRRQIGAFNGTEIRMVDLTQIENFTFDGVAIKEDIQNAYDTGIISSADPNAYSCSTGNVTATVSSVTDKLEVGDMFVVGKSGKYYLVRVDEINEDGGSTNTNTDNYKLSIKY